MDLKLLVIFVFSIVVNHSASLETGNDVYLHTYNVKELNLCKPPGIMKSRNGAKTMNKFFKGFQRALANVHHKVQKERQILESRDVCDSSGHEYRKFGIKDLNPTRRESRRLGVPRNRKTKVLSETTYWLTSIAFQVEALSKLHMLSINGTKLPKRLAHVALHSKEFLGLLGVKLPPGSPVCHRNSWIIKTNNYAINCDYSTLVLRDVDCAIGHIRDVLRNCKIRGGKRNSKGKRKRSRRLRISCKGVKTAFYDWKRKNKHGRLNGDGECVRRRKLGRYEDIVS